MVDFTWGLSRQDRARGTRKTVRGSSLVSFTGEVEGRTCRLTCRAHLRVSRLCRTRVVPPSPLRPSSFLLSRTQSPSQPITSPGTVSGSTPPCRVSSVRRGVRPSGVHPFLSVMGSPTRPTSRGLCPLSGTSGRKYPVLCLFTTVSLRVTPYRRRARPRPHTHIGRFRRDSSTRNTTLDFLLLSWYVPPGPLSSGVLGHPSLVIQFLHLSSPPSTLYLSFRFPWITLGSCPSLPFSAPYQS